MGTPTALAALITACLMFLRPTQSESVMLQFGDLLGVRGGEIVERWPVFHQTG